jgi:hypothetical protein
MTDRMDKTKITDELEQLQLEETRERVADMRGRRKSQTQRAESIELSLRRDAAMQKMKEAGCWHKKGGKGVENLAHGNDANHAIIKHTLSHGPTIVICQRCFGVWEPPAPLDRSTATAEQKAEYKRAWTEYQWALNLPTDNEPSGTQLFLITTDTAA